MRFLLTIHHLYRSDACSELHQLSGSTFGHAFTRISFSDKDGFIRPSLSPCYSIPSQSWAAHPSSHCSINTTHQNIYLTVQWTRFRNWSELKNKKKTPKPAGLLFSRTIPQLVHREVHKLNTRTSVLDLSSGPFALCPAPSSSAEEQMLSEEGCKDSASTQKLIPGMRSQPPVTCDSGISWVKVSSF